MNIINTIPVYETIYHPGWSWLGFFLAIAVFIFLAATIYCFQDKIWSAMIVAAVSTGLMLFGSVYNFVNAVDEEAFDYNEYVIQVDDTANVKEFNEKYEVIEYIGEGVYKVVERER